MLERFLSKSEGAGDEFVRVLRSACRRPLVAQVSKHARACDCDLSHIADQVLRLFSHQAPAPRGALATSRDRDIQIRPCSPCLRHAHSDGGLGSSAADDDSGYLDPARGIQACDITDAARMPEKDFPAALGGGHVMPSPPSKVIRLLFDLLLRIVLLIALSTIARQTAAR